MIGLATAGRSQPASQSQLTLAGPLGHEDWDEHPMHSATVPGSVQVQVQVQVQVAERESKAWIQDANICIPTRQSALKSDMFGLVTAGKSQPASQSRTQLYLSCFLWNIEYLKIHTYTCIYINTHANTYRYFQIHTTGVCPVLWLCPGLCQCMYVYVCMCKYKACMCIYMMINACICM